MFRQNRILVSVIGAMALIPSAVFAQLSTPERTKGERTSTYAEVVGFIDSLVKKGAVMSVGSLGESTEGRKIPYVILSRPLVTTPAAAKATGKPILYIEANIHAGEVEGKESVQELMRDLTLGKLKPLLDSVIILFVPIYNTDGNERFGPNRPAPGQLGPDLVGVRPNGQGFDLNRDYVKMESPEDRLSIAFIEKWDADLFMDLHTTDGSYHGYALTWSPGLNVNWNPVNAWVQDTALEAIRKRTRDRHKVETYPYGNFEGGNAGAVAWRTYEGHPRYGTNLNGMKRVSILSEAYSHDPFLRRIEATYAFVLETIRYMAEHKTDMRKRLALAAAYRPDSVAIRDAMGPQRMDTVLTAVMRDLTTDEIAARAAAAAARGGGRGGAGGGAPGGRAGGGGGGGGGGRAGGRGAGRGGRGAAGDSAAAGGGGRGRGGAPQVATGEYKGVYMPVLDRFTATRKEAIPAAYVLDPQWKEVVDLMRRQGIVVEQTTEAWKGNSSRFHIDSIANLNAFQGHRMVLVEGSWTPPAPDSLMPHTYIVSTNQRYGVLAAFLLEPASEDGYFTWNFFDRDLGANRSAPIRKLAVLPAMKRTRVP